MLDKMRESGMSAMRTATNMLVFVWTRIRWAGIAASRPWAAVQAGRDAGRAYVIFPLRYSWFAYDVNKGRDRRLQSGRKFGRMELLKLKALNAHLVFAHSIRLGVARSVVITLYGSEGLLANLLHVLEVVHRVRPGARVHVDWVLTGKESGFRYGDVGDNVWPQLFQTLGSLSSEIPFRATASIEHAFWGTGKDYLTGRRLQKHRNAYHSTVSKWLEITSERVLQIVRGTYLQRMDGRFCIGIHRRVGNVQVADLQGDGLVPSLENFIETVNSILTREGMSDYAIFLATDDAEAVGAFRLAYGTRLIVQDQVQRTTPDAAEVHFRDWDRVSLADAEDVLVDTVLLSRCNVLIHASSSISTVASIMNPALTLVRVSATERPS